MTEKLSVGVGRTDVTPDLGVRLGGYGIEERPAEEILDRLAATTLVFLQGNIKTALINLDWVGIMEEEVFSIRKKITEKTGIPSEHIIITTSHSHSTANTIEIPGWGKREAQYIQDVTPHIVESVVLAERNLQPVKMGIGTIQSKTGVNRRSVSPNNKTSFDGNPLGPYDPTMTVVRFESQHGPVATLIHYGAHPTAYSSNRTVTRDWPGIMIDRVEDQTGVPVVFVNGSLGDVGPRSNGLNKNKNAFSAGGGMGLHAIREVGYRAATDALQTYIDIKFWHKHIELGLTTQDILFKYAPLPPLQEAQAKLKEFEHAKEGFGALTYDYVKWRKVVDAYESTPVEGKEYKQTILRLGPLVLIPFPGEVFSDISLRLRKYSPFAYTLCTSVSNGYFGYFTTREASHREGYEVWMQRGYNGYGLAENIDDLLVEQHLELLKRAATPKCQIEHTP